ncbi:MAG: hypothetical protein R3F59_30615 [Myxococcota bacterium]
MIALLPLPAAAAPTVTLLEAGAEPRAPLRYALAPGQERRTLQTDADTTITVGGLLPDPPPSHATRRLVLTAALEGERLRLRVVEASSETVPAPPRPPRVPPGALAGSWCEIPVGPTGPTGDAVWHLSAGLPPEAEDALRVASALLVPLPEAAVGPGARWQVHDTVRIGPLALTVDTVWTLQAAGAQGLALTARATATAPEGSAFEEGGLTGTVEALTLSARNAVTLGPGEWLGAREGTSTVQGQVQGRKGILSFHLDLDVAQTQRLTP